MIKLKENICPQNTICPDVKVCNASHIEQIGYGSPIPTIEDEKCTYCESCKAGKLKCCMINGDR